VILLLLALTCLAGAGFLVSEVATGPARQRRASMARAASYSRPVVRDGEARSFRERVVQPLSAKLAGGVLRFTPKTTTEAVAMKLLSSGVSISTNAFLALKGGGAVGGLVLGASVGAGTAGGAGALLGGTMLGAVGWIAPEYVVTIRGRRRRDQIRSALPDALDLLAVSVEAGLGFDAAITKITDHMNGPLSDEFALTLGEMRVGESRADALRKLEQRVAAPELSSFVRAIIQADQLGISLGRILRVQAADSRNKRQSTAEERAMKAPIKMLFPTVLFIFPAMFIVVLGPAIINILKLFNG
jgi:tight adherence protein C